MTSLTFLGLSGSLRKASRNTGLLRCCQSLLPAGTSMDIADISTLPFYNADLQKPAQVQELVARVQAADALVLACPEYNYSLAPALKNALDWLSREMPMPLAGKPGCLLGAGGGMGTCRAQYHLRQVCVYLDIRLLNKPEIFANAFGPDFSASGDVVGEALRKRIAEMMQTLAARAAAH